MTNRKLILKITAFSLIACFTTQANGQANPRQERLLNGLKVLMFPNPAADKVTIAIRIHSGASFDPQGKEGVMATLADSFFPTEASQTFFKEDLDGDLKVITTYDFIEVQASSKAEDFLTLLEAVSTAVSTPTIDKETTPKLLAKRLEQIKKLESDGAYIADRSAAERLFGTFPYGRAVEGTEASMSKLGFADVLDAKQRFLGADNATVAISGKFDPQLAYRAARRYFGSWLKSDRIPPSTFKQPDSPDTKLLTLTTVAETRSQTRFALRGVSRSERDYAASEVLSAILSDRLQQNAASSKHSVVNAAHVLPGSIVFQLEDTSGKPAANLPMLLLSKEISEAEFAAGRSKASVARSQVSAEQKWLNADTYKLPSVADDQKSFDAVTVVDVRALAQRLARNPVVAVAVFKAEKAAIAN
ncbi:MAG: pitrilysin family protein [Pyrinomonadaceae bacterium]